MIGRRENLDAELAGERVVVLAFAIGGPVIRRPHDVRGLDAFTRADAHLHDDMAARDEFAK